MISRGTIKNIVLVEDEAMYAEGVKSYLLQKSDYKVNCYTSGEECLANMHTNPDLIILDYHLHSGNGSMNGLDTLKQIKSYHKDVPVVMLSGQDDLQIAADTIKYDAFDYIVKGKTALSRLEISIKNLTRQRFGNFLIKYSKWFILAFLGIVISVDLILVFLFGISDMGIHRVLGK